MPNSYPMRRMTPEELSEALERENLTIGQFMFLTGASRLTIKCWLNGRGEGNVSIPSWVPGYLAALQSPASRVAAAREMDKRCISPTDHLNIILEQVMGKTFYAR